ncbi:uncharacterized protein LOC103517303 [Diaphorina citri]|uniref:Uncharacterized protein LOC103517303 n=1 Tax=Diaphorina citri TaxID=121845 RepID=A0A3Q0J9Y1_DIACI|nr:uncharacterized protein LOC103517303 [Diaphorina citri]
MKNSMNEMFSNENHIRHKSHGKSLHSKRDIKQDASTMLDVAHHEETSPDDLINNTVDNSSSNNNMIRHPTPSSLFNVLNENIKPSASTERRTRRQPKIGSIHPYFYSKSLHVPKFHSTLPL